MLIIRQLVGQRYSNDITVETGINTAVGSAALFTNISGLNNTAVGDHSLFANTIGAFNTAVGAASLTSNITGNNNTAVGENSALASNATGNDNTALGCNALLANSIGIQNTCIGSSALGLVTGNSNIALGYQAGGAATTGSNDIYIGHVGVAAESAAIRIGTLGTQTTCFVQGISGVTVAASVPVLIDVNGQLGTILSSERFKHNIADMGNDSSSILNLRPVTFAYNSDASETKQYGLIAEEVDQVFPSIVVRDEDGNPYTVQYQVLPALLLNELIKQQAALEQHQAAIENMNDRLAALEAQN